MTPAVARTAGVRHRWMFRAVALIFAAFGGIWLWRFGFTEFRADMRPYGLAAGIAAVVVGIFLWQLRRWAIGVSAVAVSVVGISAAVFAPNSKGPAILFLAGLALVCIVYAALAMRDALASNGR